MYVSLVEFTVLGLDIVTAESLFGHEPSEPKEDSSFSTTYPSESDQRTGSPDSSSFLVRPHRMGLSISFPKYNNYIPDPTKFDPHSKIQVPLSLLDINSDSLGDRDLKDDMGSNRKAVLSYVQYRELSHILPKR